MNKPGGLKIIIVVVKSHYTQQTIIDEVEAISRMYKSYQPAALSIHFYCFIAYNSPEDCGNVLFVKLRNRLP